MNDSVTGVDPLTGLMDRSAFDDLNSSFASRGHPWSLLIIDVDHFKLVNDIYGHLTGDDILSHVGHTIRVNLKKNDHAIRFGGDEFVVVLPDTDGNSALDLAQRLLFELGNREFPGGLHVSASLGIAESKPDYTELSELISMADQALYRAKETGRGRFVLADNLKISREAEPDFSHMVGRREELQMLRELLDKALDESARFCLITGYQGMGKTKLVAELTNYCMFRQAPVLSTVVHPVQEEDCFLVLNSLKKALDSLSEEELESVKKMAGPVEAGTADHLIEFGFKTLQRTSPADQSETRVRNRKDFARLLKCVSEVKPFVIVLDNLHWASEESILYTGAALSYIPEARILCIAVSRNREAPVHFKPMVSSIPAEVLHLNPLSRSDVRTMLFFAMKSPGIPVDVMDYMIHQSGGNALFLRKLITWCIETGALSIGQGDICNWREPSEELLPGDISAIIELMLQDLAPEEMKVLKRAALAGRFVDLNLLSLLTGMSEFSIAEILDSFVQRGFISDDGKSYSFVFGVMRSYLVSRISPSLRCILHEKTAVSLENTWKEPDGNVLAEIAHHYCNSKNREKSIVYAAKAAKRTFSEGLHSDSIHWYREYLNRVTGDTDPIEYFRAQVNTGILFSITGRSEDAEKHMYIALDLADNPEDKCAVFFRLGDNFRRKSMYPEAMEKYHEALRVGGSIKKKSRTLVNNMVGAMLESSFISRLQGRLEEAGDNLTSARHLLDTSPDGFDPPLEGMFFARLADLESETGSPAKALEFYRHGLEIAIRNNDTLCEALILNNMHGLFQLNGDYNAMLDTLKQVVKLNNQLDDQLGLAIAYYNLAESYMNLNMLDLARRYFQLYIEMNSKIGNRLGMGYGQLGLGKLFILESKFNKALEYLKNASGIFLELNCIEMMCTAELERIRSLLQRSEFEEASSVLEEINDKCNSLEFQNWLTHLKGYLLVVTGNSIDRGIFMVESSIRNAEDMTPADTVFMYGNLYKAYISAGSREQGLHALANGVQVLEATISSIKTESIRNGILSREDISEYLNTCRELGVACTL